MSVLTKKFSDFTAATQPVIGDSTVGIKDGANAEYSITWDFYPPGNTAARPLTPIEGVLRWNTQTHVYEYYLDSLASWEQIENIVYPLAVTLGGTGLSSTTINQILYSSANDVIAGLPSANSSILATDGSGVPGMTQLLPHAVQVEIESLDSGTSANIFTFWRGDGTWAVPAGSGTVSPANANEIAYYAVGGNQVQGLTTANDGVLITSGAGVPSISSTLPTAVQANITVLGALATPLVVSSGGTGANTFTAYSVICGGTTATGPFQNVAGLGTLGFVLTSAGAGQLPVWSAPATSGTVTSIATNNGVTGGTITSTGTIGLASIADQRLLANVSGGVTFPSANTLTAVIDACIGSTQGNILYRNATVWTVLAPSTSGFFLQTTGASSNPQWAAGNSGTVTNVATGAGLTGGPITTTGTISFATVANNSVLANISGGVAEPSANTLTAVIDSAIGSTQGQILYRNATVWTALNPGNNGEFLKTQGAAANPIWAPETGTGTVTSVTFTGDGVVLSSTPSSAVTTTGTLTATLKTQVANTVLAGPTTGSDATPTFRALVAADIPAGSGGINPNSVMGGNFDTNPWQRGTSFISVANSFTTYTADRFNWSQSGAGVINITKSADAPTVAQAGIFTSNSLYIDVTTADASLAATDFYGLAYKIEGYDWAQLAQRIFTISFWVKSTKTGIFSVAFVNSGADKSYVGEYTVSVTDTWEFKTITVTASPSAGTWDYTTGIGIQILFAIAMGSNYTGTAGSWLSSGTYASTNQVNGMDSASNNFKLQLVKVEAGSSATAWQVRSEEEELALCQRYYIKTFLQSVAPAQNTNNFFGVLTYNTFVASTVSTGCLWQFPVTMRTTPTITFYNPGAANTVWRNRSTDVDSGASSTFNVGVNSIYCANAQVAADLVAQQMTIHATVSADL